MKVVVTGGSGFLGSHVADAFTDAGEDVTILDSRESPWLRPTQQFVKADVLDPAAVRDAVTGHQMVCHFAGMADIASCLERPREAVEVNLQGTVNVLEAARAASASRLMFASTIYVYSESGGIYRATKQSCELLIEEYQRNWGLDYTILRYGTLYGPRANSFNSVRRYLRDALIGKRIVAPGLGDELREYIHVTDAARLTVRAGSEAYRNERVILSGHQPMRFADLLHMVAEIVGEVDVELTGGADTSRGHYSITPYAFRPKKALKLLSDHYTDLGQGLLECLEELYLDEGLGSQ